MKKVKEFVDDNAFAIFFCLGIIYMIFPFLNDYLNGFFADKFTISGYGVALITFSYTILQEKKSKKDSKLLNEKLDKIIEKLEIKSEEKS